jgi:hypothetical protein
MSVLKRWARVTIAEGDVSFSCKVKCLNYGEAPKFLTQMARFAEKSQAIKSPAAEEGAPESAVAVTVTADQVEGLYGAIPTEFAQRAFGSYVKDVEDLTDEEGVKIETGEQLFDIADLRIVMSVLREIQTRAAGISKAEGKDSSSQPGPSTDQAPTSGAPDAPSTGSADGTAR